MLALLISFKRAFKIFHNRFCDVHIRDTVVIVILIRTNS